MQLADFVRRVGWSNRCAVRIADRSLFKVNNTPLACAYKSAIKTLGEYVSRAQLQAADSSGRPYLRE
jgi:hypothetical protein